MIGYFYEEETGFYYVSSRYYDPEIGRFISPDIIEVLTIFKTSLNEKNQYAYCNNNPVVFKDTSGAIAETAFDIISLAASVAEVVAKPSDPWAWAALIGDVIDVALPVVTGVVELTKVTKTSVQIVSDAEDVVKTAKTVKKSAGKASKLKKSTGAYVVLYEDGRNYVGKGGFGRAITSAKEHMTASNKVSAIVWAPTSNSRDAFLAEYILQTIKNVDKKQRVTFNKIWSPGKGF